MKKYICKYLVPVLLTGSCFSGIACAEKSAAVPAPAVVSPELGKFDSASENAGKTLAMRFAEAFFAAVKTADFALWEKQMPPEVKNKVNAEEFHRMREELQEFFGTPDSCAFLGTLIKDDLRDHLVVMRFRKNDKERDVIFLVRVYRTPEGRPEISGFGVKRF